MTTPAPAEHEPKREIHLVQLSFKRKDTGQADLNDPENIQKLLKYVVPVIEKNEGWDSTSFTESAFRNNPEEFETMIDGTVHVGSQAVVWIAMDRDQPVGLLEYVWYDINEPPIDKFSTSLQTMMSYPEDELWKTAVEKGVVQERTIRELLPLALEYLKHVRLFTSIGIVVIPELQGKGSNVADKMWEPMQEGITQGYTNSPLAVAKARSRTAETFFFPLLGDQITTVKGLIAVGMTLADMSTGSDTAWREKAFGVIKSKYFIEMRDASYIKLAKKLAAAGKIEPKDVDRIKHDLQTTYTQSMIITFSN